MKKEIFGIGSVVRLAAASLVLDWNTRFRAIKDQPVIDLVQSIRAVGQREPIDVYQDADGNCHIIGGHRRTMACLELGIDVEAIIRPAPKNKTEAVLASLAGNRHLHLTAMDKAVAMRQLADSGLTQAQIGEQFSPPVTKNYVSMLLNLCKLCYPAQELLHQGKMSIMTAVNIGKLDRPAQLSACEEVQKGSSDWESSIPDELTGDERGLQTPSQADEGKDVGGAATGGGGEKRTALTEQITLKMVRGLLSEITNGDKADDRVRLFCSCLAGFIGREATKGDVLKAAVSQKNADKVLAAIDEAKADKAEADKAEADKAKADRDEKRQAAKAAKEEQRQRAVAKLLTLGWTHTAGNDDQWKAPGIDSPVRLTLAGALATLAGI